MQAACEDGEAILGLDKDVLTKQKELKTILMVYELEQEHFQGVNIAIVSDANSDAPNSRDVDEEAVIEEIMRLEFKNAARDATCEAATLVKNEMFSVSDVNAVLALTKAKAQVRYKSMYSKTWTKRMLQKSQELCKRTCVHVKWQSRNKGVWLKRLKKLNLSKIAKENSRRRNLAKKYM